MIRPFTLLTMLLAGGSGLYLYSAKHQSQVLDREIARTVKLTDQTHERTDMLKAEWALLNEPDRLGELARAHLSLKPLAPTQFVAMNDLAGRLPPPAAPGSLTPPPGTTDTDEPQAPPAPVAQAAPAAPPPAPKPAAPPPPAPAVAQAAPPPPAPKPAPATPAHPTAVAETKAPPPKHALPLEAAAVPSRPLATVMTISANAAPAVSAAATAPGTIGESVLRTMRANAYAAQPAYTPPAYAPPTYAAPVQTAPASSVLGAATHAALPPPVPFAVR